MRMLQSQGAAKRSEGGTGTGPLSEASHGPQSHGAVPLGGWRAREVSWEAVWRLGLSCAFRIQYTTVLSQGKTNLGGKEGGRNWFFLWNGIILLFKRCSQNAY